MSGSERFEEDVTECQECGGEIDFTEASPFWKTADERFWHNECYDLIGRIESVRDGLDRLVDATEGDELVTEPMETTLKEAQHSIDLAIHQERLMQDQELAVYSTGSERDSDE